MHFDTFFQESILRFNVLLLNLHLKINEKGHITETPAMPELKRMPKLIWFDTGLVNFAAGVRTEIIGALDIMDVWKGHIAEQIVAQELLTINDYFDQKRCFWIKAK